ncbi:MAG: hypothetical protein ACP5NZ_04205 [Nanobdellota archaeon]
MVEINFPDVPTYKKDGRMPITEIYKRFSRLKESRWIDEVLCSQRIDLKHDKRLSLPILAFRTRLKGDALWIISGVHGEEPAGVNAIAKNIKYLNKLAKKMPIVLLPLCNPSGYRRDWRYPTLKRRNLKLSPLEIPTVSASEHYLINKKTGKPQAKKPINKESEEISNYIVKYFKYYKPLLVLDFHEDESARKQYIYSHGKLKNYDPIARKIVGILKKHGFKFYEKGMTSFKEKIIKGVVSDINDGSIDELLSSEKIIVDGQIKKGPDAKSVVVVETKTVDIPLKKRVKAHSYILKSIKSIYTLAKDIFDEG